MNLRKDPEVTRVVRELLRGSTLYLQALQDFLSNEDRRDFVYKEMVKEVKSGKGKNVHTRYSYFAQYTVELVQKYPPTEEATFDLILDVLYSIKVARDNKMHPLVQRAKAEVEKVRAKGKAVDDNVDMDEFNEDVNIGELLSAKSEDESKISTPVRKSSNPKGNNKIAAKKQDTKGAKRAQGGTTKSKSSKIPGRKNSRPAAEPAAAPAPKQAVKGQQRRPSNPQQDGKLKGTNTNADHAPASSGGMPRKASASGPGHISIVSKRPPPSVPERDTSFTIPENYDSLVVNMIAMKGVRNLIPRNMKGTLFQCGVFGSQFKKDNVSGGVDTASAINIVRFDRREFLEYKREVRQKEIEEYKRDGTLKKIPKPKFQNYKYYYEQVPLQLDVQELKLIVDASVYPPIDDKASAKAAAKVTFKLLMDIYNEDGIEGFKAAKLIFLEMLEIPSESTRTRAFNMLFNLAIHCNLYHPDNVVKVYPLLHEIYNEIFCDMALQVFYMHEKSKQVWHAVLMCFLFFFTDGIKGTKRSQILKLDPRVIVMMLSVLDLSDSTRTYLIRILVNRLYLYDRGVLKLDISSLNKIGGMGKVLQFYMHSHSYEVRNNLFSVNFDYVMHRLVTKKHVDSNSEKALIEVLKHFDIAHIFPQALRYLPKKFTEMFMDYVVKDRLERYEKIVRNLDRTLILQFLEMLEHHTMSYWKLEPELEVFRDAATTSKGSELAGALDVVKEAIVLLTASKDENDRHQGMTLLFDLMLSTIEVKSRSDPKTLKQFVNAVCTQLVNSQNPDTRLVYYRITGKLLQLYKTRDSRSDSSVRLFQLINSQFQNVRYISETNQDNLMAVFDTILELITIQPAQLLPKDPYSPKYQDTLYQHILTGRALIPTYLLKAVDIQILLHIFNNLSFKRSDSLTVCLILIMEKVRQSPSLYNPKKNAKLFRKLIELLHGKDARIAFYVSNFLTAYMLEQKPKEYGVFEKKVMNLNGPLSQYLQVKICREVFF